MEYLMDRYLDDYNEWSKSLAIERGELKEEKIPVKSQKPCCNTTDDELPF